MCPNNHEIIVAEANELEEADCEGGPSVDKDLPDQ